MLTGFAIAIVSMASCESRPAQETALAPAAGFCGPQGCDEARVLAMWDADPDAMTRRIVTIEDPVERMAAVQIVLRNRQGPTSQLCGALPVEDAQKYCAAVTQRSHLWQSRDNRLADEPPRAGKGPNRLLTIPTQGLPSSPWAGAEAWAATCPDTSGWGCQNQAARWWAAEGDTNKASGACKGIDDPKFVMECHFLVAETLAEQGRPGTFGNAFGFCVDAKEFSQDCLDHVLQRYGWYAPPSRFGDPRAWAAPLEIAAEIGGVLGALSPVAADLALDRFWSFAVERAYQQANAVTGDLLQAVPASALPHVRASAAARLFELGARPKNLSVANAMLQRALETRTMNPGPVPATPLAVVYRSSDRLWYTETALEARLDAVHYRGSGRRAVSPDPEIDATMAVIEAAARVVPPRDDLVAEAMMSPSALVRWTAARLLLQVGRNDVVRAAATETDPLVLSRLQHWSALGEQAP